MQEIMSKLQRPFPSKDIEWRVSRCGTSNGKSWAMVLAYVTNRAIQNRLDEVFGLGGWKNNYREFMQGILCTITCNINGEWVSKSDGAEPTQFESLKGGFSSAMKRAAVQWGIGRYLYNLDETFVEITNQKSPGAIYIHDKKTEVKGYWVPPKLPDWALPEEERGNKSSTNLSSQTQSRTKIQNKQPKSNSFNRLGAIKAIDEMLIQTGLLTRKELIIPLFKRVNPNIKQKTLEEVYKEATDSELKVYYKVLRPVNDLLNVINLHQISMKDGLKYVQILCPEAKIESLFSCFLKLTQEKVKEINEMIKEDLSKGVIKQIA